MWSKPTTYTWWLPLKPKELKIHVWKQDLHFIQGRAVTTIPRTRCRGFTFCLDKVSFSDFLSVLYGIILYAMHTYRCLPAPIPFRRSPIRKRRQKCSILRLTSGCWPGEVTYLQQHLQCSRRSLSGQRKLACKWATPSHTHRLPNARLHNQFGKTVRFNALMNVLRLSDHWM